MMSNESKRGGRRVSALVAISMTVSLLVFATAASADTTIGSLGTGSGQYENPRGIAVDRSNGNVFVADTGNNRIDVFDSSGNFLRAFGWGVADGTSAALQVCTATCFKGIAGSGAGQLSGPESIAVDNDPGSPSFHQVYVLDDNARVAMFDPSGSFLRAFGWGVLTGANTLQTCTTTCLQGNAGSGAGQIASDSRLGVAPGGIVYVLGDVNRLQKFESTGSLVAQLSLSPPGLGENVNGLAVDSTGSFYAASAGETGAVRKYDAAGTLLNTLNPSSNIMDLAVDGGDNLYVSDAQKAFSPGDRAILEYDPSGTLLRVFYGDVVRRYIGLAPYSTPSGDVFGIDQGEAIVHVAFPPPGPIVPPGVTKATSIGNQKATLRTAVNPENEATTFHFEYVEQAEFEANGFANAIETPETPVGSDFALHEQSSPISGLAPDTTYRFRAVATNAAGTDAGEEQVFTTLSPFEILDTWVSSVDLSNATIHAEVNPLGIPASAHFQFVDDATYKASGFANATDIGQFDLGSGEAPVEVHTILGDLLPDATYHFRIVVENVFVTKVGPERQFTTMHPIDRGNPNCPNAVFRVGLSANLPDCRAYEMVSPVEKNGGDVANDKVGFNQVATDGTRMTFSSITAFPGAEGAPLTSQYLATRDPVEGWETEPISPPREGISLYPTGGSNSSQYRAFSADLCSGWLMQDVDVALVPGAPTGVPNLYRRRNCGSGYELISSVQPPGYVLVPFLSRYYPEIQGFSADGAHSVFRADAKLTPNALATKESFQLYETYDGGKLRLVSILPDGTPSSANASAGMAQGGQGAYTEDSVQNAVSANGSRIFWTAYPGPAGIPSGGNGQGRGPLYLRLNATDAQSKISGGECTEPTKACTIVVSPNPKTRFVSADPNGTRAIYTVGSEHDGGSELYGFDVASEASHLIAAEVMGVMGASEDAGRVYFTSEEVLGSGASAGEPNLYFYDASAGGSFDFIGTLTETDSHAADIASGAPIPSPVSIYPSQRLSRVSPDGLHTAFFSTAPLTGYDNTDAKSREADGEIFRYDAESNGGDGGLLCVSCDPTGARPTGRIIANYDNSKSHVWAAAEIPGWPSQTHPSNVLSADGNRVFFNSTGPLLPADSNGRMDVYQWEAPGSGDCTTSSSSYFAANGGCLSLISTGLSPFDSEFLDATPTGSSVFFGTDSSLVAQDEGLFDVYVARVNGGFPPPPPAPPPCVGDACQSVPAAPNDPTPASAAFRGPGSPSATRGCPKGKRRVVRRGKSRCVARNRKERRDKRRANRQNRRNAR